MRRHVRYLFAVVALVGAACSDNQLAPDFATPPARPTQPAFLVTLPTECTTPAQAQRAINGILPQLFVIGGGRWITAIAYNIKIQLARHSGNTALVKSTVGAFINFTLEAYYSGNVSGGQTPESQARVLKLIYLLYCSNSITPIPDLSGIFDAQNTVLVTSNSPTTVVGDPLDLAAVKVERGDVPSTVFGTFISVHRTERALPTSLDWYGVDGYKLGAFEFVANPPVLFDEPVLAGVCISFDDVIVAAGDLRLAHGVEAGDPPAAPGNSVITTAGGTIEIAAYSDPGPLGLACSPLPPPAALGFFGRALQGLARLVVPGQLYAGVTGGSTGGTVRKFSPFAAVDIKLNTSSTGPSSPQYLTEGSEITAPVSVTVTTRNGETPIDGIPVSFAPGESFAPASAFTDGNGTASSIWTLVEGTNTGTGTPALTPLIFVPATAAYSVNVLRPVTVTGPVSPITPIGVTGTAYPGTSFTATGGNGTYTWAVISGALPAGLTLTTAGLLSGTPTAYGTFTFTVQATSGVSSATTAYTLTILAPVSITTTSPLPYAKKGYFYSKTLQATGGTGTYTWTLTSGSLPGGLSLSAAGVISGTPTSTATCTFTVRASSGGLSSTKTFSLTVKKYEDH